MVVIQRDGNGTPTIWCDPEIADLVRALNDGGVRTIASCSGHGARPGNIALEDGRELIIARNFDEARIIERAVPQDINGERVDDRLMSRWLASEAKAEWAKFDSSPNSIGRKYHGRRAIWLEKLSQKAESGEWRTQHQGGSNDHRQGN